MCLAIVLSPSCASARDSWVDRIMPKADIRLRHNSIDEDGEDDRVRGRFRTRFGPATEATDDLDTALRLASGSGTDADGHLLKDSDAYSKKIFVGDTLFLNDVDRVHRAEQDFNRPRLDVEFNFT